MVNLIKYRVFFITILFGLFGTALVNLLRIDELKVVYTSVSFLVSLVISLLISFLLKLRWNVKARNRIKIISSLLFIAMLLSVFIYIEAYDKKTFSYRDKETRELFYYVKGDNLQPNAIFFRKAYLEREGKNISDEELVLKYEGPANKDQVWTSESIKKNRYFLIINYLVIVFLFVTQVCLLSEILVSKYGKSTAISIEKIPKSNKKD